MVRMHKGSWQRRQILRSIMGSCCSCIEGDPDGSVLWYQPGTHHSIAWCKRETGFGYRRRKSYRQIAIGDKVDMSSVNRVGNLNGELSGRIVAYEKASKNVDYSTFSECPTFNLGEGEKLFAKAFFPAPLNRVPIGENNIRKNKDIKGRGATILAPIPQAVAIFMDIDGVAQCNEHYCRDSLAGRQQELKDAEKASKKFKVTFKIGTEQTDEKSNSNKDLNGNNMKAERDFLRKAVKGSFYTFVISDGQFPFCFLHLPLIGNLHDTNISTGYYGENLIRCFCEVIRSLPPGAHKIDLRICLIFDHMEYNYLVLGVGTNALGKWSKPLANSLLKEPHEKPSMLVCSRALAKGSFSINVPNDNSIGDMLNVLDRKPPPEIYQDGDCERIRKIARTVAAGKYCEMFNVSGLPDWVVLSSGKITKTFRDQGRQYSYTMIEYAALWLNDDNDVKPDAIGTMIEGAMAQGELSPGNYTYDWVWAPKIRNNRKMPARSIGVKNKFINTGMKGRRFSVFSIKLNASIPITPNFLATPSTAWEAARPTPVIREDSQEDREDSVEEL